jgi:hypothetical protein
LLFSATENFSTLARALLSYLADKTDFRRGNAQAKKWERRKQTLKKSTFRESTGRQ